jgi:microcystin-dependent protein
LYWRKTFARMSLINAEEAMTQPFIGQIQSMGFDFAPMGWAQCNGQVMAISQNAALFSLLGTTYGGNGTTTFGLPDLQSRVPMSAGQSPSGEQYFLGEKAGAELVTLTLSTLPAHSHTFQGSSANGQVTNPAAGQALARSTLPSGTAASFYGPMTTPQPLNPASVGTAGGNLPHTNIQPYQVINWCIALSGVFPPRS